MTLRIAHATDIHWFVAPSFRALSPKRVVGSTNLYVLGRKRHFDPRVQAGLVDALRAVAPDAVVITGDLTAQALASEFAAAADALAPLFAEVPTLVMNGNHDVYTFGASRARRIEHLFTPQLRRGVDGLGRLSLPGLHAVALDPTRPHLFASGVVPDAELAALPAALAEAPPDAFVLLGLHYPLLDRHALVYDGLNHGLRNARALIDVLRAAPRRPDLIIHGHIHHGFRTSLDLGDVQIPICNPGSGGYARLTDHDRAACFNVYTVDGPTLVDVQRLRWDGARFVDEPGGAYATGR